MVTEHARRAISSCNSPRRSHRAPRLAAAAAAAAVAALAAGRAHAQAAPYDAPDVACPAGEVASAGHCCGANQAWDLARSACEDTVPAAPNPETTLPAIVGGLVEPIKNPATATSPIGFVAANASDVYVVSAQQVNGNRGRCATPCTMLLSAGYITLDVGGAGRIHAGMNVGYGPVTFRIDHRMTGRTLGYVAGGLVTALGVGLLVWGIASFASVPDCTGISTFTSAGCMSAADGDTLAGILTLTFGLTALPIGLVILAASANGREISVLPWNRAMTYASRGLRFGGFAAAPIPGGGAGSVRLVF